VTEIDIQATLKLKLDVDVPPQVNDALSSVADEAGQRLAGALDALTLAPADN
jgi:hypothetical protein